MTHDSDHPGDWRALIHELAAFDRASASEGERRAAQLIAERLRDLGCRVTVEEERAHGGYWWPIGLVNAAATTAGLLALRERRSLGSRIIAATMTGIGAAALWDDLGHGRRWFRRALLPHRSTWNVVAEAGDPAADRTVVLIAHHDAAHSGLIFHPVLPRIPLKLMPRLHAKAGRSFPLLYAVWLGPVLVCLGALAGVRHLTRAGAALAAVATAAMTDIGLRSVVPGANDNLAAVGALVAIAAALRDQPLEGIRVLLVSTGSEESFSEGMQGFGHRHFGELDPDRTEMVCLECLGGPTLIVIEGEGMLRMRDYPSGMREALDRAAAAAGIPIVRGLRTTAATDAIIALRAGYSVATLASVDETKLPMNYHWPSDRPEALHWETVEQAITVCDRFLRRSRPAAG
ncbi:MAG TPA: M28 family peptidase [Solirubrobacteraceae bacterium]|nr:M28 family peptidase [Solirubrobacteraceae bacterium]